MAACPRQVFLYCPLFQFRTVYPVLFCCFKAEYPFCLIPSYPLPYCCFVYTYYFGSFSLAYFPTQIALYDFLLLFWADLPFPWHKGSPYERQFFFFAVFHRGSISEGGIFFICNTSDVQLSRKALSELSLSYELDLLEETLCDRLSENGYSSAVRTDKELIDQMVSHAYNNMKDMDEYDAITETISDFESRLAAYDEAEEDDKWED